MAEQQDCASIAKANALLESRIEQFDSEIRDLQGLADSLYPDDPQRPDVQRKVDDLARQQGQLIAQLNEGKKALQDCLQSTQGSSGT